VASSPVELHGVVVLRLQVIPEVSQNNHTCSASDRASVIALCSFASVYYGALASAT
jgi:hypothetical protein